MFNSRYNALLNINPINDILSTYPQSQIRPFKLHWLNSAHLETLLPGSSWEKIYDAIITELCDKIHSQFSHETRKQALFELLGKNFVSKYFPHDSVDVNITKPPFLSSEENVKLFEESEHWLDLTLERIIKEKGIYVKDKNIASDEMKSYISQTELIFYDHFYKEQAKKEAEYLKHISTSKRNFRNSVSLLHHKPETAVSSVYDDSLPDAVEAIYPYGPEMMIAPPPHCNSFHSEFIGMALANVGHNNELEIGKICKKMRARRLPISLRKFIWKNLLMESESPIYHRDINFEELIREKFSRTVTRGIGELKISKEICTPVNELIEHLIVEQYERCLPLVKFNTDFKSEAVKILNVLYVYDRSYDRHLIFWLFPLHYGLKEEVDNLPMNKTTFSYEIAMCLNLLRNVYPTWPDIFKTAEEVILLLSKWDPNFVNHILEIAQKDVISQSKEFLAQIMDMEKRKTKNKQPINDNVSSRNNWSSDSRLLEKINSLTGSDLIKSPIIFIRKWIGEGFVSILKNEAVLFIFDQLFMEKFQPVVFQDACLAIILLLKNDFLNAQNHEMMKNVFLKSPFNLLTLDIIRAWAWLHKGGSFAAVPDMNRKEKYSSSNQSPIITKSESRPPSVHSIMTPRVSFNDFRLKLILGAASEEEASFIFNIQVSSLFLSMTMYFEEDDLLELLTRTHPHLKLALKNDNNTFTKTYYFDPDDIIEFQEFDVSHMMHKFKEGDIFFILIRVQYQETAEKVKTLGWCTFQCFHVEEYEYKLPQLMASDLQRQLDKPSDHIFKEYVSHLKIQKLRQEIPLVGGDVPKTIKNIYLNKNVTDSGTILKTGSILGMHSYDPILGPPTPRVRTPVAEIISEPIKTEERQPAPVIYQPQPLIEMPVSIPKSQPTAEVRPKSDYWVPFNSENYEKIKPPLTTKVEPFCLYLDQIRFIPDTATIIKITGRFVKTGLDSEIPDILVFPNVETEPRSPTFTPSSRQVINENRKFLLNNSTLLVLRVYTVLKTNLEIVVVGTCIIQIFDQQEGILLSGCYQKRLRNQSINSGLINSENLTATSLDNAPYVDCVSITFRLWPYTKNPIPAPDYKMGYYKSMECQPTNFEWEIFELYKTDNFWSKDLRDFVRDIKYRDNNMEFKDIATTHSFMQTFIPYRLDIMKHLPENQAPRNIHTELMFHYRIEKGIHFKLDRVFGLKDEKLLFATAKVIRGSETANKSPRPMKTYGSDDFNIFCQLDPNLPMRSSKWNDQFQVIRPYYDEKALLVIQIWGISAIIINGEFCHKTTQQKIVKLSNENIIGWTAVDIFRNGFVNTGKHQMPLYQNRIHLALLKRFQNTSIASVLQKEDEFKDLDSDSIVFYLLDGHKKIEEYPSEIPVYTEVIDSLPEKKAAYLAAMNSANQGKTVYSEIVEMTSNLSVDESKGENKLSNFNKLFSTLANKLSVSIPPKQPYMPILLPNK